MLVSFQFRLCLTALVITGCAGADEAPEAVLLARKWGQVGNAKRIGEIRIGREDAAAALLPHLKGLPRLQSITVAGVELTDDQVRMIAEGPPLRRLMLDRCGIRDAQLDVLAKHQRDLVELILLGNPITDQGVNPVAQLEKLESLWLEGSKVQGGGLRALTGLDALLELRLAYSPVEDAGLDHINRIKHLKILDLTETRTTGSGLLRLKDLVCLDDIHFGDDFPITIVDALNFRRENLAARAKARAAGKLTIEDRFAPFSEMAEAIEQRSQQIEKLKARVRELQGIDNPQEDPGAVALARRWDPIVARSWEENNRSANELKRGAPWIQHVRLESAEGVAALAPHLRGLPFLTELTVSRVELTPKQVQSIADGPPLRGLALAHCALDDENLERLAKQRHLESLELTDNPITDEGLRRLGNMSGLKRLGLKDTKVTGPGLLPLAELVALEIIIMDKSLSVEDAIRFRQAQHAAREKARAAGQDIPRDRPSPFPDAESQLKTQPKRGN